MAQLTRIALALLTTVACGAPEGHNATHVVMRLDAPWPAGVGRASPATARAIRSGAAEASLFEDDEEAQASVEVTLPRHEWLRLEQVANGRARLLAQDATAYYAERATTNPMAASPVDGRALAEASGGAAGRGAGGRLHAGRGRRLATGSMGGFYTLEEAYAEMERLRRLHPTRLSNPILLGKTRQGRPIQAWCLTDGLVGCEPGGSSWLGGGGGAGVASSRPAVLYTALVHAREPQTLMCLLRFVEAVRCPPRYSGARKVAPQRGALFYNTRRTLSWVYRCPVRLSDSTSSFL